MLQALQPDSFLCGSYVQDIMAPTPRVLERSSEHCRRPPLQWFEAIFRDHELIFSHIKMYYLWFSTHLRIKEDLAGHKLPRYLAWFNSLGFTDPPNPPARDTSSRGRELPILLQIPSYHQKVLIHQPRVQILPHL